MKRFLPALPLLLLVAACNKDDAPDPSEEPEASAPAEAAPAADAAAQMGLVKASVFDDPDPIVAKPAGGAPGTNTPATPWGAAPPNVPHSLDGLLPITAQNNACTGCHDRPGAEKAPGTPTPIPASHYRDGKLAGARWFCDQCHVPLTDAKPLVDNTAGGG